MNRRDFGRSVAAVAASLVFPHIRTARRRTVDLMQFCSPDEPFRFAMQRPFEQHEWTYATDAKICVRVRPQWGDLLEPEGIKPPPAFGLRWDHDQLTGWKPLKLQSLKRNEGCGDFMDAYLADDIKVDVKYFRTLERLGDVEWAAGPPFIPPKNGLPTYKPEPVKAVRFRFAEGVGLLGTIANT